MDPASTNKIEKSKTEMSLKGQGESRVQELQAGSAVNTPESGLELLGGKLEDLRCIAS